MLIRIFNCDKLQSVSQSFNKEKENYNFYRHAIKVFNSPIFENIKNLQFTPGTHVIFVFLPEEKIHWHLNNEIYFRPQRLFYPNDPA